MFENVVKKCLKNPTIRNYPGVITILSMASMNHPRWRKALPPAGHLRPRKRPEPRATWLNMAEESIITIFNGYF